MSPINQAAGVSTENATEEYLLHYVGSQIYGHERFIAEAKTLKKNGEEKGVQRAIPFSNLKSIKWGQPVLVGEYTPKERPCHLCELTAPVGCCYTGLDENERTFGECGKHRSKGTIKTPVATVFGYFYVDRLSYVLDPQVVLLLAQKLDVVEVQEPSGDGGEQEDRACGSYLMGETLFVRDSIKRITTKIEEACKEVGVDPLRQKYFIRGPLTVFDAPIILEPCKFVRGYFPVKVECLDLAYNETPESALVTLHNYEKRAYLKKTDAERYDRILIDDAKEKEVKSDHA